MSTLMNIKLDATVVCGECKKKLKIESVGNKSEALELARQEGWAMGRRSLCPDCKSVI